MGPEAELPVRALHADVLDPLEDGDAPRAAAPFETNVPIA